MAAASRLLAQAGPCWGTLDLASALCYPPPPPRPCTHVQLGVICRNLLRHLAARLEVRHSDVVLVVVVVVQELEEGRKEAPRSGGLRPREGPALAQLRREAAQHLLQRRKIGAQRVVRAVPTAAGGAGKEQTVGGVQTEMRAARCAAEHFWLRCCTGVQQALVSPASASSRTGAHLPVLLQGMLPCGREVSGLDLAHHVAALVGCEDDLQAGWRRQEKCGRQRAWAGNLCVAADDSVIGLRKSAQLECRRLRRAVAPGSSRWVVAGLSCRLNGLYEQIGRLFVAPATPRQGWLRRGRAASDVWLLVPLWLAHIDPPASHRVLQSNLTRAWRVMQSAEQTQGQNPPLPHLTGRTCATPHSCSRDPNLLLSKSQQRTYKKRLALQNQRSRWV